MTYALLLYVLAVGGGEHGFVIDYNLTHEDCARLEAEWKPTLGDYARVVCSEEPTHD